MGRFAFCASLLACACGEPTVLERVEPPRGLVDRRTTVVLVGKNLEPGLAESGPDLHPEEWRGNVGGKPLLALRPLSRDAIEAVVPAGLPPGAHDVVLELGGREVRLVGGFGVAAPVAPRIDAAFPRRLPARGGPLRLSGVGFHFGSVVSIGGVEISNVTWRDDQVLELEAPPGPAGLIAIEVTTPNGRAARRDLLRYEPER